MNSNMILVNQDQNNFVILINVQNPNINETNYNNFNNANDSLNNYLQNNIVGIKNENTIENAKDNDEYNNKCDLTPLLNCVKVENGEITDNDECNKEKESECNLTPLSNNIKVEHEEIKSDNDEYSEEKESLNNIKVEHEEIITDNDECNEEKEPEYNLKPSINGIRDENDFIIIEDDECDEFDFEGEDDDDLFYQLIKKVNNHEYKCQVEDCKQVFSDMNSFQEHIESHSTNNDKSTVTKKNFTCDVCNNSFTRSFTLKQHKTIHTGEKPYKCTFENCLKNFRTSSSLKRHKLVHANHPYKCALSDTCKLLKFSTEAILEHHFQTEHNGSYKCCTENCNKTFSSLKKYKHHQNIIHAIRPHKCDLCHKSYCDRSSLRRHKKVHNILKQ